MIFSNYSTLILSCLSEIINYITTKVVSSNPVHGEVYLIQHYVIKFVSHLRKVGGFLWVLRFPPPIKHELSWLDTGSSLREWWCDKASCMGLFCWNDEVMNVCHMSKMSKLTYNYTSRVVVKSLNLELYICKTQINVQPLIDVQSSNPCPISTS